MCARWFWQACWRQVVDYGVPGHCPTKLEQLWARRPGACSGVLLILLAPFAWSCNWLGQRIQEHTMGTLQVGQSTWIELLPTVRRHIQWCSPAPQNPENSQSSWKAPATPQTSLYDFSLSFVVQKVVLYRSDLCVGCVCARYFWQASWSWTDS